MHKWLGAGLLGCCSLATLAGPLDAAKSQLRFVFTQMNVPVEGAFRKFSGDIRFDPAHPEAGQASLKIELAAADAGSEDANEALKGGEWFNAARFPQATFTASSFKALGGGRFQVSGQLSLKGRQAAITLPFTQRAEASGQWLEGAFPLSRLAWKVGEGDWSDVGTVADAVQVRFKLFVPK